MKEGSKKEREAGKEEARSSSLWMYIAIVAIVALFAVLVLYAMKPAQGLEGKVSPEDCSRKVIGYINENYVQTEEKAALGSVTEKNGVYEIVTRYQGREIPVHASLDCRLLFLESVEVTESETQPTPTVTPTPVPTVQRTEKPVVDLYVMSFCPYGVQAENAMKPVVDLLGAKAEIKVRFIAGSGNGTVESVQSLHGIEEAKEDLRQLCIQKLYPSKFWEYLMQVNTECYPLYRNATALDACWKAAAESRGINASRVESCAYGQEGMELLKEDGQLVSANRVTGSPTMLINGYRYGGARSPEAFKQAICSAFLAPPPECAVNLSAQSPSTSGQC